MKNGIFRLTTFSSNNSRMSLVWVLIQVGLNSESDFPVVFFGGGERFGTTKLDCCGRGGTMVGPNLESGGSNTGCGCGGVCSCGCCRYCYCCRC